MAVLALISKSSAIKLIDQKKINEDLDYLTEPNSELMYIPEEGIYVGT